LNLAKAPGNVSLPKGKSGLPKDSVANVSQINTLDKEALTEVIGSVDRLIMQQVEEGIKLLLNI
jgi:mRNA interferase MazF